MQIEIKFKGYHVSATLVKGQERTWENPEYEDELVDFVYDLSNNWFDENKKEIMEALWEKVPLTLQETLEF